VKPGFVFPPSDIADLKQKDPEEPVSMDVAFMGLIGPSGVLPHWYNELAVERQREKDSSMIAFFDMFHHRLISLFYLGWKKYRLSENYLPGAEDPISRCFLSLVGLGTPGLADRLGLPAESLMFHSGLFSRAVPSCYAIREAVGFQSETEVEVEQFIDRLMPIDPEDQTQLGSANSRLGVDAMCGGYAWESQTRFRVHLGPMGYGQFGRFLPSGDMLGSISSLVRYMVGIEYEFEFRVFLKREEVPPCVLGAEAPTSPRLGWSTWVKSPEVLHEADPYVTLQELL
jgi:type VI secretion system protein ImpH